MQEQFQEKKKYKLINKNNYLFNSDILTANKCKTPIENEQDILRDNQSITNGMSQNSQPQEASKIYPYKAMLKFRCAYLTKINESTEGEIYIQAWAPASSIETISVPYNYIYTIFYDNVQYEEQMFYYHSILLMILVQIYHIDFQNSDDLDDSEVQIHMINRNPIDQEQLNLQDQYLSFQNALNMKQYDWRDSPYIVKTPVKPNEIQSVPSRIPQENKSSKTIQSLNYLSNWNKFQKQKLIKIEYFQNNQEPYILRIND